LFEEALNLEAIFNDRTWPWGRFQRSVIERGIRACELLAQDEPLTEAGFREVGVGLTDPDAAHSPELARFLMESVAEHAGDLLSTMCALYGDDRLRHTLWEGVGDHDF
jgi:hypothetical protein